MSCDTGLCLLQIDETVQLGDEMRFNGTLIEIAKHRVPATPKMSR